MNRLLQRLSFLIIALSCTAALGFGQIYVDADATGNNDGSTWADAYVDLQDALAAALPDDEIWVAEGTYVPGTDTLDFFQLVEGVRLYGGFAGTETAEGDRDPSANVTILSGDPAGDDVPGDSLSRLDNVFHVLFADSTITNATIVDGFTISGGTSFNPGSPVEGVIRDSGGGLLTAGSPIISNCIFTQNSAGSGGGIFANGMNASSLKILDCEFNENEGRLGGGVFLSGLLGGVIDNCSFTNNTTTGNGSAIYNAVSMDTILNCTITGNVGFRGALMSVASNAYYENLTFDSNEAVQLGGSAILSGGEATFQGCTFTNETAGERAGVMYVFDGTGTFNDCEFSSCSAGGIGGAFSIQENMTESSLIFNDCSFTENSSGDGGVLYHLEGDAEFNNCVFEMNTSTRLGGAIAIQTLGGESNLAVNGCTFTDHLSANGGVIFTFDGNSTFTNSEFISNSSDGGGVAFVQGGNADFIGCRIEANLGAVFGGAGLTGFGASSSFTNCIFDSNESTGRGAAWWTQNDFSSNSFIGCQFNENIIQGGTLSTGNALGFSGGFTAVVDSCDFTGNNNGFNPDFGNGGAIWALGDTLINNGNIEMASISITRSQFVGNQATVQGGAVDLSSVDATIENCLFAFNQSDTGTIINNSSSMFGSPLTMTNNTLYFNQAAFCTGLVQWESPVDSLMAEGSAVLQNNIIGAGIGGPAYAVQAGTPTLISNGGNVIQDESFGTSATADDIQNATEEDIALTDPENSLDFTLTENSVAVDAGVNSGAPTVDITGEVRLEGDNTIVDAGAYEFGTVSSRSLITDFGIGLSPTVTSDVITVTFKSETKGDLDLRVYDYQGRMVMQQKENKGTTSFIETYNVGHLPAGTYFVRIITEGKIGGGKFIVTQ